MGIGLLVAVLGGAAIGLEREWSGHASGPQSRFGGIRTFTLLGGLGGIAGWMSLEHLLPLAVVLLAAAGGLVVSAYVAASRTNVDGTTEVAAVVVLAAGVLAGSGRIVLSSAVIAATAVLLVEKSRLHGMVERIDDAALRASIRFAALACIVLPLLPEGPYGPGGAIRPRELWALVLFFSGLSFGGWFARRLVGPQQGVIVSGLLGGVVSSTSVTFSFARESREERAPRVALAAGTVGACTVMVVRVMVACLVLNPALALLIPPYVGPAFVIGTLVVLAVWRVNAGTGTEQAVPDSPLQLGAALQMAALFQVVLFAVLFVRSRWGSDALVATSALLGLTDLDALTLSLARSTSAPELMAPTAAALAAGVLANTLLKMTVAVVVGRGAFRAITGSALAAIAVAIGVALAIR